MSNAAILPALSVLTGIVAGVLVPSVDARIAGALLMAAWTIGAIAHLRRREALVVPAVAVAFAVCGLLLSARALDEALHSSLTRALEDAHVLDDGYDGQVTLEGRLRSDAVETAAGIRVSLVVSCVTVEGRTMNVSGGASLGVAGALARERVGEWRAGRRVRVPALVRKPARYLDPGVPDQEIEMARRGTAIVGTVKSGALVDVVEKGRRWDEAAASARAWARRMIDLHVGRWSRTSAAIVTALLIGDRAGLPDAVEVRLQEAGTYHVIAISGGNIALLAGAMAGLLALARVNSRRAAIVPIAALLAYAWLVGGGASVVRATAMAIIYLAARAGDHRSPPLNALAVSAALILCASPLSIFDAGFALTFGATLAILIGSRRLRDRLPRGRWIRAASVLFAASVCAEAALFPVGAFVFSRVTFAGLVLNFAAIPLMALAQLGGMATLALAWAVPSIASGFGFAAHVGAAGVAESARAVDFAPWLTCRVPPPAVLVMAAYYAGAIAWVALPGPSRLKRVSAALAIGAGLWILAAPASLTRAHGATLDATFLDVGQGDAVFVRFPNGRSLLVDAGGTAGTFDVGARVIAPALWAAGLRRLTYLAVTHGDPDHIGGAASIVRDFGPGEVWYGVPVPPHEPARLLRTSADAIGAAWRTLQRGDVVDIGDVTLHVWHPPRPDWERQRVRNDDSLVLELRIADVSILLTGDAGASVEPEIIAQLAPARVRIVKAPHHGSGTSSSEAFIQAARPALVVFSCGRGNRYGHPVPFVVARYAAAGAAIFRTDQDGAVTVRTDGRTVEVTSYVGRSLRIAP
jgi:competence protein ComEC